MARKPVPVPRVIPFQPPLPFRPLPQKSQPLPEMMPERREAACSPSRLAQMNRVAAKLYRLVLANPYAGGLAEFHIDRLLEREEEAA